MKLLFDENLSPRLLGEVSALWPGSTHVETVGQRGFSDEAICEGEITLLVDEGETTVHAGDIVIRRGTKHGWANRSGKNCRIAFILIDGKFTDGS